MSEFTVGDTDFLLDGRPVRLLSGALHYFRVHEAQWGHRLRMLRAMGLNCVETYVPWNRHEPRPGGFRDVAALGRFLDAAAEAGLWAIVRPGPYICAEWENGGLPHWVPGRARTRDGRFVAAVEAWFARLLPQVVSRQIDRGGPVVLVQVENEYGSYGSDARYLAGLAELLRALGVTVPLFTSDGPEDHMLTGGSVPGVLATVNFGSHAREAFRTLRAHRPDGPLMCMEFWCGWFDHWGAEHVVRDPADAAKALREVLGCGASVNLYMAHGGTSFAGWAGANRGGELHDGPLEPDVTSYDYDAPVDEAGRPTPKFWAFREVLAEYAGGPLPEPPPPPAPLAGGGEAVLTAWAPLEAVLEACGGPEVSGPVPPTFEELDVDRGLVRYEVTVPGPRRPYPLTVRGLRDLAVVYVDGERAGVLTEEEPRLREPVAGHARVELWVESLGRVNYGPRCGEAKGITGGILHERQYLHDVRARGLRLDDLEEVSAVPFGAPDGSGARGLYRGTVTVRGAGDALLELPGWTRGFVWLNGFNLGRYWSAGPQRALFVPGPVLVEGENEIRVLELEGASGRAPVLRSV
ncbi:beta-galactosidase [Streptomyces sp. GXMU-J15]|uniref:Beta-galactosidase n=1 Tax=Streptomyces fuscus TaxID=3048495 RepID=A0ABT7JCP4_9ACTN|nr:MULTISPECIES: beta-galactosidase family protein [Streptomyces]MDL2082181.1 beta-galactosidase [Streptomyces fuscus]SBT93052.1 beta-galactosidase [Streptomyces sp. DI166]